jgi:hypothetical protein
MMHVFGLRNPPETLARDVVAECGALVQDSLSANDETGDMERGTVVNGSSPAAYTSVWDFEHAVVLEHCRR